MRATRQENQKSAGGKSIRRGFAHLAAIVVSIAAATSSQAQVGTGGLVFFGDRVVKESIASTAPIAQVAAGTTHTVAVRADGSVVAWGAGTFGQCDVPKGITRAVQAAAGTNHTLILLSDGTVRAFGNNLYNQCSVPAGLAGVTQVCAGSYFSAALKSNGTVVVWGDGQSSILAVPTGLNNVVQIAAGESHVVALQANGNVVCWGSNGHNECTMPAGLSNVIQISAWYEHSGALRADGTVVCWGSNVSGGSTPPANLTGVVRIALGVSHGVALKADGTVVCWGSNASGEATAPAGHFTQIAANFSTSYGLTEDGTIVGWGDSSWGETTPPTGFTNLSKVVAGWDNILALKHDGTLAAWGRNIEGQCKVPVIPGVQFTDVSAGAVHGAATGAPNSYQGLFGRNTDGQIPPGTGSGIDHLWAICRLTFGHFTAGGTNSAGDNYFGAGTLAGTDNFIQITGGAISSLGLRADGTLKAAGNSQFGLNTVPAGLSGVVQIASGYADNLALKSDGTIVGWGMNNWGQSTSPAGLGNVVQVAAGYDHSAALKSDGTVVCWGGNSFGQISAPAGLNGIAQIAATQYSTVCLPRMSLVIGPYGTYGGDRQTGTVYLVNPAPAGGTTVGLSSSDSVVMVPASVTVPAGQTSVTFTVNTAVPVMSSSAVVTATLGTLTQDSLVSVIPASFNLSTTLPAFVGGSTATPKLTITLGHPAPPGGLVVTLASSNPSLNVPSQVTFSTGQTARSVVLTHSLVTTSTPATITATSGSTVRSISFAVNPFQVKSLSVTPSSILGGASATATISLTATPTASINVAVTSSDPATAPNPGTLTFAAGSPNGTASVPTNAVTASTTVTFTASLNGVSKTDTLQVLPVLKSLKFDAATLYGNGSTNATLTLSQAAPAGGLTVSISAANGTAPASVIVPAGATTVTIPIQADEVDAATVLTLTVTSGSSQLTATRNVVPNTVATLVLTPTTAQGGSSTVVTATITLKGIVSVDTLVAFASSDATAATVPSAILVPAGQISASVIVTHAPVATSTKVKLTVTYAGAVRSATLTLTH